MPYDPRGSLWRRWDLHFHSPTSFDYAAGGITPDALATGLANHGIAVAAVTDHHRIDPDFIARLQEAGQDAGVVFLPAVELRSELGGGESVHYIGIFPEDCDLADVWTKLQSLGISASDVTTRGNDNVYVPFAEGASLIHGLGGIVTVHAGRKSNTFERISNAEAFKRAAKVDLMREHVDVLDIAGARDAEAYRTIVFPHIGWPLPLVVSSDNHDIRKYETRDAFWVRADPGFRGLLQLINEPESRGYIGQEPPLVRRVRDNPTKVIDRIAFSATASRTPGQNWFDGEMPTNPGMVAIIGSKGGGKSALADTIGLLGNSRAEADFSFLSTDRFLSAKLNLGAMFEATITWADGSEATSLLGASVDQTLPELVKYIPQSYLERICTEFGQTTDSVFDDELREVIYSHVAPADRLGKETLSELIAFVTKETTERIEDIKLALAELNVQIVQLEDETAPEFRARLEGLLAQKRAEIAAHDKLRPAEVLPPEQDSATQEQMAGLTSRIQALRAEAAELEIAIQQATRSARANAAKVAAADKLLGRLDNLERQFQSFRSESAADATLLEVSLDEIVRLTTDRAPIDSARATAAAARGAEERSLDATQEGSLAFRLEVLQAEIVERTSELDEPTRRYEGYVQALAAWEERRRALVGTPEDPESETGLGQRLLALEALPAEIAALSDRRVGLLAEIVDAKLSLLARYRKLFEPVQEFIERSAVAREHRALDFHASIVPTRLIRRLLDMVHQGKRGSFAGDAEGEERLAGLVDSADFSSREGVENFVRRLVDLLWRDDRDGVGRPVRLRDQLRQGTEPEQVYDLIFGLDYLQPRFELTWNGRGLDQLSPGERGSLLLVFYLLIDLRDVPLIIDQPEENLDNETITELLVPAVKEARARRQLILVTHSPNLAVVCDADQVVHARIDRADGNRITYTTGSIENPVITPLVVDVLEGTMPAFENRGGKYADLAV